MKKIKIGNSAEAINAVTQQLIGDITALTAQKTDALSTFRQTAVELGRINETWNEKVTQFTELMKFAESQRDSAQKAIDENEAVRRKILDIIGE